MSYTHEDFERAVGRLRYWMPGVKEARIHYADVDLDRIIAYVTQLEQEKADAISEAEAAKENMTTYQESWLEMKSRLAAAEKVCEEAKQVNEWLREALSEWEAQR